MNWKPFVYFGHETNIELNIYGDAKRVYKPWMKLKRKEKLFKKTINNRGYNTLFVKLSNGREFTMLLHQALAMTFLGHEPNKYTKVIDHIDNDKQNNHISNLQITTQRENAMKYYKDLRDLPMGVFYYKGKNVLKYRSYIVHNKKQRYLGRFNTPEEASAAYQEALRKINAGEFATN